MHWFNYNIISPKKVKKQQATGRTKDGAAFPLSISIKENQLKEDHQESRTYQGLVWVFTNISGLVSVLPNGVIYSCNKNFSLMLFGYSDDELVGKVTDVNESVTERRIMPKQAYEIFLNWKLLIIFCRIFGIFSYASQNTLYSALTTVSSRPLMCPAITKEKKSFSAYWPQKLVPTVLLKMVRGLANL